MKKLAVCLLMCWVAVQVNAAEWLTDLPKALEQAKAEKKLTWSIILFKNFPTSSLVLLFPPRHPQHKS